MGDVVEITSLPNQERIFYKITSGSIRFQVKGTFNAGIGLARTPRDTDCLWFVLGNRGCTTVIRNHKELQSVRTPNILCNQQFRNFWLQWHSGVLSLGREYSEFPFIVHHDKTSDLKYITFGVYASESLFTLQWKFEMPPLRETMQLKPVSKGDPKWVPAEDQLPDGALIGGFEKEILYIIRAEHERSLTPGKFVPSHGVGYIPWGGGMHEKSNFEVLCGYNCMWVPCSSGRIPAGSVQAGHSEGVEREPLYVGRARYHDHIIPGKVQPSHNVCYIPYDEREIAVKNYEILIVPHKNIQGVNPNLDLTHVRRMM